MEGSVSPYERDVNQTGVGREYPDVWWGWGGLMVFSGYSSRGGGLLVFVTGSVSPSHHLRT